MLHTLRFTARALQAVALIVIATIAVAALLYTTASTFGLAPWLTFSLEAGAIQMPNAGIYMQIGLTILLTAMAFVLPTNTRIMALEQSHRKFQINMHDVARAYHLAHSADRQGVFTMSSEFDAVRERLAFMRDHPDLENLEGDLIEVAAQMSEKSRDLADTYSEEKIARAKRFLKQRQEEAERQQEKIVEALHACTEIRQWAQQVEVEESIVDSQLARLDDQLQAVLPELGYQIAEPDHAPDNIVPLQPQTAAE